jgi:hypothetical protein
MLAGPHPRSLSLGGCAPHSGRRRFRAGNLLLGKKSTNKYAIDPGWIVKNLWRMRPVWRNDGSEKWTSHAPASQFPEQFFEFDRHLACTVARDETRRHGM